MKYQFCSGLKTDSIKDCVEYLKPNETTKIDNLGRCITANGRQVTCTAEANIRHFWDLTNKVCDAMNLAACL